MNEPTTADSTGPVGRRAESASSSSSTWDSTTHPSTAVGRPSDRWHRCWRGSACWTFAMRPPTTEPIAALSVATTGSVLDPAFHPLRSVSHMPLWCVASSQHEAGRELAAVRGSARPSDAPAWSSSTCGPGAQPTTGHLVASEISALVVRVSPGLSKIISGPRSRRVGGRSRGARRPLGAIRPTIRL